MLLISKLQVVRRDAAVLANYSLFASLSRFLGLCLNRLSLFVLWHQFSSSYPLCSIANTKNLRPAVASLFQASGGSPATSDPLSGLSCFGHTTKGHVQSRRIYGQNKDDELSYSRELQQKHPFFPHF